MTGRLPSSVICPHNTYPSCVGVPAESVRALCHRALCRTFSHVFLREQSVLSAPFFFFLFGGLPKKPFFSHTKKVAAVLLVVFRVLWGSEHREKKRRLGFLDWMVSRLSSFSKSMNIFNFLIIDLNTRLFWGGGTVMMISEKTKWPDYIIFHWKNLLILDFERCFMRQRAKIVSPSSAIMCHPFFFLPPPLFSTAC